MSRILMSLVCGLLVAVHAAGDEPPKTGPETEKRFPPLKVPAGFKATLFACDPLVEYPSAMAMGPRPGTVILAFDYMTGLGTEIIRRDEVRLVEDTDGDGYADRTTLMADGFNSIMGLTYHDGVVYVVHSPFVTAIRDVDGDGVAEERKDLLNGVGLPPEENDVRLHCGNGIAMGHDGWLYIALGDHGCNIPRPEGDRLIWEGGAILRCRPDGRDAHVFSKGLRNIYDVALDDELNVFVRDNENDGGDYKIRVCHSFYSADHGYPYLYYERPDEAMPPLADLGLGSSAGGVCYLEHQFPAEYQNNLFFCEWGRAVMRCVPRRDRGGFAKIEEIEFAAGAENDPYGFKPTDVVVDRDGSLLIADWADGQRPKRGRARIYRITHESVQSKAPVGARQSNPAQASSADLISQLDSPSYYERIAAQRELERCDDKVLDAIRSAMRENRLSVRGRLHGVWILARRGDEAAFADLFAIALRDSDPAVRAQSVRAIADLTDPVLVNHRLTAQRGNIDIAARLADLAAGQDDRVVLEIIVALGRLKWPDFPSWMVRTFETKKDWDAAMVHAAMQALRSSENWPEALKIADRRENDVARFIVLRAAAGSFDSALINGLISRLKTESEPQRRSEFVDLLTRVHRRPGPWVYWGYRPLPRTANSVDWEKTAEIARAVDATLEDADRSVRFSALRRMQREKVPASAARLNAWLNDDREPEHVAAILHSLRKLDPSETRVSTAAVVRDAAHHLNNRQTAYAILLRGMSEPHEGILLELAQSVEAGPVLAEILRSLAGLELATSLPATAAEDGRKLTYSPHPALREQARPLFVRSLHSASPEVRAAALEAVIESKIDEAEKDILSLLDDPQPRTRQLAARAAGKLKLVAARDRLLELAVDGDPGVRRSGFEALRQLDESRVLTLAVAALNDQETQTVALDCIGTLGDANFAEPVFNLARRNPSAPILDRTIRLLTEWDQKAAGSPAAPRDSDRRVAIIQGNSGSLIRWQCAGPFDESRTSTIVDRANAAQSMPDSDGWQIKFATAVDSRLTLSTQLESTTPSYWLAATDIDINTPTEVQFLGTAAGPWRVWLNGKLIHQREASDKYQSDSDRFRASLHAGSNRVVVRIAALTKTAEFQLHFRPVSAHADKERLVQAALSRNGNVDRGRKLVSDAQKTLCIKCHRIGDQGERVGPELTGVGSRFSRIHLIESILEPSRTIAPSFESMMIVLNDGRVLQGLKTGESGSSVTFVDNKAEKFVVPKSEIEATKAQPTSPMPDDLVKRFTADEFVDLIAYLQSLKETAGR